LRLGLGFGLGLGLEFGLGRDRRFVGTDVAEQHAAVVENRCTLFRIML
jgi:hypothetical protein